MIENLRPLQISFGRTLLSEQNRVLRERINRLAKLRLDGPLHVDTVLGFDSTPNPLVGVPRYYLLFDYHQFFSYRLTVSEAPDCDSIIRFIVDGYSLQQAKLLGEHLRRHSFVFLYEPEVLDILDTIWSYRGDSAVHILNLHTGDIAVSAAQIYPSVSNPGLIDSPNRRDCITPMIKEGLAVNNCAIGPSLRVGLPPSMDDLVSADLGIIREQAVRLRDVPVPIAVAKTTVRSTELISGGKHFRVSGALRIAQLEAIERFHIYFPSSSDLTYSSFLEIAQKAICPESLFFKIQPMKPNDDEALKKQRYTSSTSMYWTWVRNPLTEEEKLVPAQEVWFTENLPGEHSCIRSTTNGCALGSCHEEAAIFAIFELLERDAYLTTWYLRRSPDKVDPDTVRSEKFQLLWRRIRANFPNHNVHFYDLRTDVRFPCIAAIAVCERGQGPKTLHACAVDLDPERAMFKALLDVGMDLARDPPAPSRVKALLEKEELVRSPDDHRDLYTLEETFGRLSFFDFNSRPRLSAGDLRPAALLECAPSYDLSRVLRSIIEELRRVELHVFLKDITLPMFTARGIACARAIIPGLYPLWFGYDEMRFSITPRLKRLAERFAKHPVTTMADINLDLHPFS